MEDSPLLLYIILLYYLKIYINIITIIPAHFYIFTHVYMGLHAEN